MGSFKIEDLPIKIKRNGVQRLFSKIQLDDIITKLILRSGLTGPPTDLLKICQDLELKLYEEDLSTDGYLVESPEGKGIIFYRGPKYLAGYRWRFTVAHEIAHWVLEKMTNENNSHQAVLEKIEDWCNNFAGKLLIPDQWLNPAVGEELTNFSHYSNLIRTFEVSEDVLVRRLWETMRISTITSVYSEGRLTVSSKWPSNLNIEVNELEMVSRLIKNAQAIQEPGQATRRLLIGPIITYGAKNSIKRYYIISLTTY
jgi:Zn-dependent peptidase ImmA (M78 family)